MTRDVSAAKELAERLLSKDLPRRWSHVAVVADRAQEVAQLLDVDSGALVSAAWLHDIGYAPDVTDTGFHPLDGARYLRKLGFSEHVVALVAHHSCAVVEAEVRGLGAELVHEFPPEKSRTEDALWFCDMTTGPDGQPMTVEERLAEIRVRYGPEDAVTKFVSRAERYLVAAVRRTEAELRIVSAGP